MEVTLRTAAPADAAAFAHVQTVSWKAAFRGILDEEALALQEERLKEMWAKALEDSDRNIILELDGEPHCIAVWNDSREDWFRGAELICIHSMPDHWHEGYGSMVMERVLQDAKNAGYGKIMLWVFEKNTDARLFYEKHGFRQTANIKTARGPVEVMYQRDL